MYSQGPIIQLNNSITNSEHRMYIKRNEIPFVPRKNITLKYESLSMFRTRKGSKIDKERRNIIKIDDRTYAVCDIWSEIRFEIR